jgi:hypothetical protein
MKPHARIDAFVLGVYQVVVDWSGRKPGWWVEHAVLLWAVSVVLRIVLEQFNPLSAVSLAATVGMVYVYLRVARSDAARAAFFGHMGVRLFTLCFAVAGLGLRLSGETVAATLGLMSDLGFLSTYYFGACKPPAPPRRRTQTKLGLST